MNLKFRISGFLQAPDRPVLFILVCIQNITTLTIVVDPPLIRPNSSHVDNRSPLTPPCAFGGSTTTVFTVVRLREIKVLSIMLPQFAYFKMPYTDAQHYALWFRIILGEN